MIQLVDKLVDKYRGLNGGSLVSEATALPTEPQPLQRMQTLNKLTLATQSDTIRGWGTRYKNIRIDNNCRNRINFTGLLFDASV